MARNASSGSGDPPPRLYVLPARDAPVAVVMRRGPSEWWHLLRWNLDRLSMDAGAWFRGMLYPRRSDVSPDGRLLGYFAFTGRSGQWDACYAISKVPWLTALAAWRIGNTWAAGCEFIDNTTFGLSLPPEAEPDHGGLPEGFRLGPRKGFGDLHFSWELRDVQNELRRGWEPVAVQAEEPTLAAVPAPQASIKVLLRRPHPIADGVALVLAHLGNDFRIPSIEGALLHYVLSEGNRATALDRAAWADWDGAGRLLVGTRGGTIEVLELGKGQWTTTWSHDLRDLSPNPTEAPAWAQMW